MSVPILERPVQATPMLRLQRARTLSGIHDATCRHCQPNGTQMACSTGSDLRERVTKLETRCV